MDKVSIYRSFDDLPASYVDMFGRAGASAGIFSSLAWFHNLAATVPESRERLHIYGVESDTGDGKPYLVLPMRYQVSGTGGFTSRRLSAVATYYTSLFHPIVDDAKSDLQKSLDLLAKVIVTDSPRCDSVDLHPLDPDTILFNGILEAFRSAGMVTQRYFCFGNWYLEVNGRSYQQYFGTLPARLKNTLKRKSRRWEDMNCARIEIVSSVDETAKAIAAYDKVYGSSWKEPEPYPWFMPGLIRTCAKHGWLRMGIGYIGEQPVAAQVWIVCNGVASIYKLAYDEQFATLSVGSILTARLMQHVIDVDRVREVDFLSGDEPYKRDWMSHRRERWGIIAFNLRTLNGALAACRHMGGRALRKIEKDIFSRRLFRFW